MGNGTITVAQLQRVAGVKVKSGNLRGLVYGILLRSHPHLGVTDVTAKLDKQTDGLIQITAEGLDSAAINAPFQ